MSSRPLERLRGGGEIEVRDARQGARAKRRGDRVTTPADGHQIAVVDVRCARSRRCRRERPRGPLGDRRVAREQCARRVEDGRAAQVDRQRCDPAQRALGREARGAHSRPRDATVGRARDNARVSFTRIAWLVTVLACVVTGVALLLSGYVGYAAVFGAVGACAAINLR